ncbi:hypothetical protein DFH06DRAFT_1215153 [Mycena polygramma]|nr:hypothetical protein DFH06DRAFT_1215153 [Mycena polygramma]
MRFSVPRNQRLNLALSQKAMSQTAAVGAIIVCLLATAVNLWVFNALGRPQTLTFRDMVQLRRPNQFIGLEKVETHPDAQSVLIYPNLLSQINRTEPHRVYGDDPDKFAAWGGLVAPEDRQFKVTPKISTIVEFQAIDYKMENCELTLLMSRNPQTTNARRDALDIWVLQLSSRLDIRTLSWKTRPARVRKIDSISMAVPRNYTHSFPCPLNSLHAFEFSAANDATFVEWSQGFNNPLPAVVMLQHPST